MRAAPHPYRTHSMTLRSRLALGLVIIAAVLMVPLVVARAPCSDCTGRCGACAKGEFQASLVLGRLRDALGDVRAARGRARRRQERHGARAARATRSHGRGARGFPRPLRARRRGAAHPSRPRAPSGRRREAEFAAMRAGATSAGRLDLADAPSRRRSATPISPLSPAEQVLRTRTSRAGAWPPKSALGRAEQVSLAALLVALAAGGGHRALAHPIHMLCTVGCLQSPQARC